MPDLRLLPTDRCVEACQKSQQKAHGFREVCMEEKAKEVIHVQPAAVPQMGSNAMQDANYEPSNLSSPVCAELGAKMAHCVVIHAVVHFEAVRALLVRMNFDCLVCGFEV